MKRMVSALVVAAALMVPAVALADRSDEAQGGSAQSKPMSLIGSVSAVATDSLTVKAKGAETKFSIDKDTEVTAKGASRKSLELKAEGKSAKLTDFVKVGDSVTVTYTDGATKLATKINVTTAAK